MSENGNGHKAQLVDLSYWLDPEPLDFKYGERLYHSSFNLPAVLHARIAAWFSGLTEMSEESAESLSVELTAKALKIEETEAATINPLARKTLLGFLVSGRLPAQATTQ